ncbi:MAG: HEAT repeat domain-containing protein [Isosphaeraceae bacterium]
MRQSINDDDETDDVPAADGALHERSGRSSGRPPIRAAFGLTALALLVTGWWFVARDERTGRAIPVAIVDSSGKPAERLAAVRKLEMIDREFMDGALASLAGYLRDPEARVRAAAATAMVTVVIPAAADPNPARLRYAVGALLACLNDPAPEVRAAAARAAWMVVPVGGGLLNGFDPAPVTTALVERLGDDDPSVRLEAIRGLGGLGSQVGETPPPELVAALDDAAEANGETAALALATYRQGLPSLLPSIVRSLDEHPPRYRKAVVRLLEQIQGPPINTAPGSSFGPAAVEGLIAALDAGDPVIRDRAVKALASFRDAAGPAALKLARNLEKLLGARPAGADGSDADEAVAIIDCLREVLIGASDQHEAAAALAKALQPGRGTRMRVAAARALGKSRPDPAVFQTLTPFILDRDPAVRHAVLRAIHDVDFADGYTIPKDLATALEDPSAETRADAAAAIGHSGLGGDAFIPALVRHGLHDPSSEVRAMCGEAIDTLRGRKITRASIPHLIEGLESTEGWFVYVICQALARFGPEANAAVPRIRELQASDDERSRRAAAEALARIEGPRTRPEPDAGPAHNGSRPIAR